MRIHHCGLLLLGACTAPSNAGTAGEDALVRDTSAYAVASCLMSQDQPYLREQGEKWAGAVVQRGAGPIEAWTEIAVAVKRELAQGGIAQGQGEGPTSPTVPMPMMTCGEIGAAPEVAKAIAAARVRLAEDYRGRSAETRR